MGTLYINSGGTTTNSGSTDSNTADIEGASLATVGPAGKTSTTAVTNGLTVTAHGYTNGMGVIITTSGTIPTGLSLLMLYFVYGVDADTVSFHTNVADAEAGTNPVSVTAGTGSGTHTLNNYTLKLGEAKDLSGVKTHGCYVTTTGTSHVFTMQGGIHGIASGDAVRIYSAGTIPGGLTSGAVYYANALTTTTFRLYSTSALAVSGGASDIDVTSAGSRQITLSHAQTSSVYIDNSNVASRKIYWIVAVSDANNLLILNVVPTLSSSPTDWRIGGRFRGPGSPFDALRPGDEIVITSDISAITSFALNVTASTVRDPVTVRGDSPTNRRSITSSSGGGCLYLGSSNYVIAKDLIVASSHATAQAVLCLGNANNLFLDNIKVTDSGNQGIAFGGGSETNIHGCEVSGAASHGIQVPRNSVVEDTYVHDNGGDGISAGDVGTYNIVRCTIERNTAKGINFSGASVFRVEGCTIYRQDSDGVYMSASGNNYPLLKNNIIKDNGDAATEYNVNIAGSRQVTFSRNNVISIAGGRGGGNVLNFSLDASDLTSDPLMVDPDNATASSRNFNLQSTSPAKAAGYSKVPGSGTISYLDIGAAQRQESGASGGVIGNNGLIRPGRSV